MLSFPSAIVGHRMLNFWEHSSESATNWRRKWLSVTLIEGKVRKCLQLKYKKADCCWTKMVSELTAAVWSARSH
jgi:hypothetical protein